MGEKLKKFIDSYMYNSISTNMMIATDTSYFYMVILKALGVIFFFDTLCCHLSVNFRYRHK